MKRVIFFLFLVGCSTHTFPDLRKLGEVETGRLVAQLEVIETKEELRRALPKLKKRFNKMADLLIQAKELRGKEGVPFQEPSWMSDSLFAEMARLYEIPGGRELIETAQKEAVIRLIRSLDH
jgi:hypothetical protein